MALPANSFEIATALGALEGALSHANKSQFVEFQRVNADRFPIMSNGLYSWSLLAAFPPIAKVLADLGRDALFLETAVSEGKSILLQCIGVYVRPRAIGTSLPRLLDDLLGDWNYHRDLSLYNPVHDVSILALMSHLRVAVFFEWYGIHDVADRNRYLEAGLNQCRLVRFDPVTTIVTRLSVPERVVAQVKRLLRTGPTDSSLRDLHLGNHAFALAHIVRHPTMEQLCLPNVDAVAALLRSEPSVTLEQQEDTLIVRLSHPPADSMATVTPLLLRTVSAADTVNLKLKWLKPTFGHFTVLTYNVLAPSLTSAAHFPERDLATLTWEVRRHRLFSEIHSAEASIVCLQELQFDPVNPATHTSLDTDSFMRANGYKSILAQYHSPNPAFKPLVVGLFYKDSTFELVSGRSVLVFSDCLKRRFLDNESKEHFRFSHAFAVARLRHRVTRREVTVASVHVIRDLHNRERQLAYMQAVLDTLKAEAGDGPVLLCGDFNSTVHEGVVSLVATGRAVSRPVAGVRFPYRSFGHTLDLAPAYTAPLECTTARTKPDLFVAQIDYIFASNSLQAVNTLRVPGIEECMAETGLPNARHPSDHLPIGAAYSFL
eukprot:m.9298 g.9298  ORF g.9298 m.9298 type:complete len:602 (+) comp5389_c1_seq1:121-1926(+)